MNTSNNKGNDGDDDVNGNIKSELNGHVTYGTTYTSDHRKRDKDSTALESETSFTKEDTTALIPAEDTGSAREQVSSHWCGLG